MKIQQIRLKKQKKQVWFASLVWYDIVSSVETSLFRPRKYLVGVLEALEAFYNALFAIIYGRNYGQTDGNTDEQIRPSIMIDVNIWIQNVSG